MIFKESFVTETLVKSSLTEGGIENAQTMVFPSLEWRPVTAKSLLLDLLRATEPNALPVSLLVNVGKIFALSENAMRVNINRLLNKGQIEQDERGYYRVGPSTLSKRAWLNQWQQGENRLKDWQGDWCLLTLSADIRAKELKAITHSCEHLGFRELQPNAWVRPNNIQLSLADLSLQIKHLSGSESFYFSVVTEFYAAKGLEDPKTLWDVKAIEARYQTLIEAMDYGLQNKDSLSLESQFKQSYLLGGEATYTLSVDPLLPAEMIRPELRIELTRLMNAYNEVYRSAWNEFFQKYQFHMAPTDLESRFTKN